MSKLIIANLKMNLTYEDAKKYKEVLGKYINYNLVVCPSFLHLDIMRSDDYILGSQNGFYIDKGAYTGEVSFHQLKDMGVKYSLIGHSERRNILEETEEMISKKLKSCLNNEIIPIVCIGETIEEKKSGKALEIIGKQIRNVLTGIKIKSIIIAYEPVWAVGSSIIPSRIEIEEAHMYIKKVLKDIYNVEAKVLYGGSVNVDNAQSIISINGVDGLLIGSGSIDPNNLIKIINNINL